MKYTGEVSLLGFNNTLNEGEIEVYGRVYSCVLNKFYILDKTYNEDVDVIFQFLDFGAYRLSYRECTSNSNYEVIHNGKANKTFDYAFFGNLKKCINDRMIEIKEEKASFLKIEEDWQTQIDNSMEASDSPDTTDE